MQNKRLRITFFGLLAVTKMTMAMDTEPQSSTISETQTTPQQIYAARMFAEQSGRVPRETIITTSPRQSRSVSPQRGRSVSPRDDYEDTNSKITNSSPFRSSSTSPRKQIIGEVLDGEQSSITYEPIVDNMGYTDNDLDLVRRNKITGTFTNDLHQDIPLCTYVNSKDINNAYSEITYESEGTEKTITIECQATYNQEKYIIVTENIEGINKKYAIVMQTESQDSEKASQALDLLAQDAAYSDTEDKEDIIIIETQDFLIDNTDATPMSPDNSKQDVSTQQETENIIIEDIFATETQNSSTDNTNQGINSQEDSKNKDIEEQIIDITPEQASSAWNKKSPGSNGRNPKYTVIGATFLAFCIALAYKYDKLPDVFAKLLDSIFAQCNNLIPSRFTH